MLGDTAVAVHPDDHRYKHLHGGFVQHPLDNRHIPVIADDYVDMNFGTGSLTLIHFFAVIFETYEDNVNLL